MNELYSTSETEGRRPSPAQTSADNVCSVIPAGQRLGNAGRCYPRRMCGRYSVAIAGTALVDVLELDGAEPATEWSSAYSVAPRTRAPVIRHRLVGEQRVREAFLPTWGLRPSWIGPAPTTNLIPTPLPQVLCQPSGRRGSWLRRACRGISPAGTRTGRRWAARH